MPTSLIVSNTISSPINARLTQFKCGNALPLHQQTLFQLESSQSDRYLRRYVLVKQKCAPNMHPGRNWLMILWCPKLTSFYHPRGLIKSLTQTFAAARNEGVTARNPLTSKVIIKSNALPLCDATARCLLFLSSTTIDNGSIKVPYQEIETCSY